MSAFDSPTVLAAREADATSVERIPRMRGNRQVLVPLPDGHLFHCTRCNVTARPDTVRERVQIDPPLRTLFHGKTMKDWSECGGLIEVRPEDS